MTVATLFASSNVTDDGLAGREGVGDELRRVRRPLDDVDLLAVELVDDVLDAHAAHSDAGADRIDLLLPRGHGDLGAETRLASDLHDLDRAGEDLRDLLLEEPANEARVGAGDDQLRTTLVLVDLDQEHLDPLAGAVTLVRHLLPSRHDRLGFAQLDDDRPRIGTLHDAVEDLALLVVKLFVDCIALVVPDTLQDDLLHGLRGNAAEVLGRALDANLVADPRVGRVGHAPRPATSR